MQLAAFALAFGGLHTTLPRHAVPPRMLVMSASDATRDPEPKAVLFDALGETNLRLQRELDELQRVGGIVTPTAPAPTRTNEPETSSAKALLQQVKDAGIAGAVSYAGWELAFWAASVPVCLAAYYAVTSHLPDLSDAEDRAKLGAEAFAFVNVARFAVPLRIGLALSTVPWVKRNIIDQAGPLVAKLRAPGDTDR